MADDINNNKSYGAGGGAGGGEVSFESWLEDLWRPFEGDSLPRMDIPTGGAVENTNATTSASAQAPLQAEASTSSISTSSTSTTSSTNPRYTPYPYHPRIECKCPNGPGAKPARHWRTKCPFNAHRPSKVAACEACGRPFNRVDNLKRHMKDVHGVR